MQLSMRSKITQKFEQKNRCNGQFKRAILSYSCCHQSVNCKQTYCWVGHSSSRTFGTITMKKKILTRTFFAVIATPIVGGGCGYLAYEAGMASLFWLMIFSFTSPLIVGSIAPSHRISFAICVNMVLIAVPMYRSYLFFGGSDRWWSDFPMLIAVCGGFSLMCAIVIGGLLPTKKSEQADSSNFHSAAGSMKTDDP